LDKVLEAFAVTLLVCLLLLAMGNLVSVRYPRPADPASSWRNSSGGKSQFLLLVAYPLMSIPVGLAYLARYAFETQTAFYLALAGGYVVGAITYYVAMESAVEYAGREQEATIAALSKGEGPFGG
jgi:ABC-2 type transport system permease protein